MNGSDRGVNFVRYECSFVLLGQSSNIPLTYWEIFGVCDYGDELLSYPSMSEGEEIIVRDFLDKITVVGLDNNIKELAIAFRKNYKLKLPDAIVAATAKSLNANLLTNDLKLRNLTEINSESVSIS